MNPARFSYLRPSLVAVSCALLAFPATAQRVAPDSVPKIGSAERAAIVRAISADIEEIYVFPELAVRMVAHLKERLDSGGYERFDDLFAFTAELTSDLRSISHDRHLGVLPLPPGGVGMAGGAGPIGGADSAEGQRRRRERLRRANYGFERLEILEGNVGYLDLRQFADASIAGPTAIAAMNFLAGTDAVIVDLRQNGGGSPSMIQLLSSYFFEEPVHLNSFYLRREDRTDQFWSHAHVEGPRLVQTPLYILTSGYSFSAAEEFSYNMRHLERATLVGETTGGGAHPSEMLDYPELGVHLSVPFGRAVNPITGTNWEGTGVEPHVRVPAAQALATAHRKALEEIAAGAEEERRRELAWTIEGLGAEAVELAAPELAAYVGTYGPRNVRVEGGRLVYQRQAGPIFALVPVGDDRFHLANDNAFRIRFERDSGGRVVTLVGRYQDGREEPSPRTGG